MTRQGAAVLVLLLLAGAVSSSRAEQAGTPSEPEPLADNSFLIEEAYNQDRGVVQHIALLTHRYRSSNWALGITQEWPAWSSRHQVSYTVPMIAREGSPALGDAVVHYRYQWRSGEVALAPRFSLLVPTGSQVRGTTVGGMGLQAALPVSLRLSPRFSAHLNAGFGVVPSARLPGGQSGRLLNGFTGASLVAFVHPRINLLAEGLLMAESSAPSRWSGGTAGTVGVRWGHDLAGDVQVVPGLGWAFGSGSGRDVAGPLAYLSVEHRFR